MIICNSRRFIFVHLMKCAGTAIDATLAPHMRWNDIRFGTDVDGGHLSRIYWARHRLHKHASAAMIRDVVGQELWDSYLTMATVRCPYERVASAWGFIAGTLEPLLAGSGFPVAAAPEERMAWLADPPPGWHWRWPPCKAYLRLRGQADAFSAFLRSPEASRQDILLHTQYSQLSDPADGRLLVREVIRVEELGDRWPRFAAAIGLPGLDLVRANETPAAWRIPARELFTRPEDIDYVTRLHAEDFHRFGYQPWPGAALPEPAAARAGG
jgi:hypothetical protein